MTLFIWKQFIVTKSIILANTRWLDGLFECINCNSTVLYSGIIDSAEQPNRDRVMNSLLPTYFPTVINHYRGTSARVMFDRFIEHKLFDEAKCPIWRKQRKSMSNQLLTGIVIKIDH